MLDNLRYVRYLLNNKDYDWFHVNLGYEGSGKSTLGLLMCLFVDPTFNIDMIAFNTEQFYEALDQATKGSAVFLDEGVGIFYSRDALKKEVKDVSKILTLIRAKNIFFCCNVADFWMLDKGVRGHRVRTLTRVVRRGHFECYTKPMLSRIKRDVLGTTKYPRPAFSDRFDALTGEFWDEYYKKKMQNIADNLNAVQQEPVKKPRFTRWEEIGLLLTQRKGLSLLKPRDVMKEFRCGKETALMGLDHAKSV